MKEHLRHRAHVIGLILITLFLGNLGFAQLPSTSIDFLDEFYLNASRPNFSTLSYFAPSATVEVISYDEAGYHRVLSLTPKEYAAQADTLQQVFEVDQQPVVILSRYYGHLATAYLSLYTRLIDKETQDTLRIRSIQAVQLIKQDSWKIVDLVVQNEVGNYPFEQDLWPKELTQAIPLGQGSKNKTVASNPKSSYDPNKIYRPEELDIAPEYPGNEALLTALLDSYGITMEPAEDVTPFTVTIEEDGLAVLAYVGDLSGSQIEQAKSFVGSMLIWYPGVKDEASVRTKLIFYMR